jgi:hypothetical protein
MYRITASSPDQSGNLLRARWLESATSGEAEAQSPASKTEASEKKPAEEMPALPTLPSLPEEKPKESP